MILTEKLGGKLTEENRQDTIFARNQLHIVKIHGRLPDGPFSCASQSLQINKYKKANYLDKIILTIQIPCDRQRTKGSTLAKTACHNFSHSATHAKRF